MKCMQTAMLVLFLQGCSDLGDPCDFGPYIWDRQEFTYLGQCDDRCYVRHVECGREPTPQCVAYRYRVGLRTHCTQPCDNFSPSTGTGTCPSGYSCDAEAGYCRLAEWDPLLCLEQVILLDGAQPGCRLPDGRLWDGVNPAELPDPGPLTCEEQEATPEGPQPGCATPDGRIWDGMDPSDRDAPDAAVFDATFP